MFDPMPPPSGAEDKPLSRPKAVHTAFQASVAGTVIGALGMVFTVLLDRVQLTALVRDMLEQDPAATGRDVPGTVTLVQWSFAFGVAAYVALFVLFAFKMRGGRNWARLLLTAFAVYGAITFLSGAVRTGADLALMWNLAEVAFAGTAVYYMFRKESTEYFMAYKNRRRKRP